MFTVRRLVMALFVAIALQTGVFAWRYRDLIYLRQPVDAVARDADALEASVETALQRTRLTAGHLEAIAVAGAHTGRVAWEVEALSRRLTLDPDDVQVRLRLADALRRAGDLARAETLYLDVLRTSQGVSR
jgi:thioredoxin-like negative regulator of GroEL